MGIAYETSDLESWDERVRVIAAAAGLDCYPQEFEICDQNQMLGYMAYSGMPSHYPHWSYGKSFEKLKTLYDHGVSGLPYEMVINSNPSLAYLMRDNSLLLQILTIAHVYGHNDFFKNNFTFRTTRAEYTLATFKSHASRIRHYAEDPGIGIDRVEALLDAAHALSFQCRRNLSVRKETPEELRQVALERAEPRADPFASIHRRQQHEEPELRRIPVAPDFDLLLFIRDHNPYLKDWERDVLTIVHEEAQYFIPQIETKIMNEGWATFWHREIVNRLSLPQELHIEFLIRHNQVVRPHPGGLNPYHLGLRLWDEIRVRAEGGATPTAEICATAPTLPARDQLFFVRETDRDSAFLRRHLTPEIMRELDLFQFRPRGDELVIDQVADEEGWEEVKNTLIASVGMGSMPVIQVEDADFSGNRTLYLVHLHDGRDLQQEHAARTLAYVHQLWQRGVVLETVMDGKKCHLWQNDQGFSVKPVR